MQVVQQLQCKFVCSEASNAVVLFLKKEIFIKEELLHL